MAIEVSDRRHESDEEARLCVNGERGRTGHESAEELAVLEDPEVEQRRCGMNIQVWRMLIGVAIVTGIAFSWVGATQFAQSTYSVDFNAPFFTTWFSTAWMLVVFPVYFLPGLLRGKNLMFFYRDSESVFGRSGLHLMSLFTHAGPFCILWILTNYLYIRALGVIHAADVTALFSSSNAFVYVFSWIWLQEKLSFIKISAVLLSIGGIVLMAYGDGFGGANAVGVVLSVGGAVGAALYKVFFKRLVGDANAGQVSLFLSCLGLISTLLLWPVIVIFQFTEYEHINWGNIPWVFLCGTGALALIFNFLINFGIAFTFPLFISLGTVIGIPINALTDFVFRGEDFGMFKIFAAVLIIIGFLLMLIPDLYEDKLQRKIGCKKGKASDTEDLQL